MSNAETPNCWCCACGYMDKQEGCEKEGPTPADLQAWFESWQGLRDAEHNADGVSECPPKGAKRCPYFTPPADVFLLKAAKLARRYKLGPGSVYEWDGASWKLQ